MLMIFAGFRQRRIKFYGITGLMLLGLVVGFLGFDYLDEKELAINESQTTIPPQGQVSIMIKVNERILEVYNDGSLYKIYKIAVGKSKTPTPIGEWKVVWKDYGWGGGFGSRWMGLNVPWGTLFLEQNMT